MKTAETKTEHYPKASMCLVCEHAKRDCSNLPFHTMQVLRKDADDRKAVKCNEFKRRTQ